jgi:hypothetical protein
VWNSSKIEKPKTFLKEFSFFIFLVLEVGDFSIGARKNKKLLLQNRGIRRSFEEQFFFCLI